MPRIKTVESTSFSTFWHLSYFQDFGMSAMSSGGVTFAPAATAIEPEPIEIGQDNLKTQLASCISDLEKDRWEDVLLTRINMNAILPLV